MSKPYPCQLQQGNLRRIDIVDITLMPLDARNPRVEQPIPHPGLLAVIMAVLPALAMMKIMVLNHKLHVAQPEQPSPRIRSRGDHTQAAMAQNLREHDVLLANPPLVESHRESHQFQRAVRDKWSTDDVDEFLRHVRVRGEERIRVLRQVVGAMEFPEMLRLVGRAVEDIVPEVEDERVHARFEEEPAPSDR